MHDEQMRAVRLKLLEIGGAKNSVHTGQPARWLSMWLADRGPRGPSAVGADAEVAPAAEGAAVPPPSALLRGASFAAADLARKEKEFVQRNALDTLLDEMLDQLRVHMPAEPMKTRPPIMAW